MNLIKRVIIGIVFIPILLWFYYRGGMPLKAILGLLTVLTSYEIIKMYENKGVKLLYFNVVSSFLFYYCIIWSDIHALYILFFIFFFNGLRDVLLSQIDGATQRISGALLTVLYPAIGFSLLFRLSSFHDTLIPVLAVLIWITDTCAYFAGTTLGKRRDIFKCSPKKSIEGFIAGIVFAFVAAWFTRYIDQDFYTTKLVILLGISAGIMGQIGDLFESLLKRDFGVKDSSNMLPGHGGMLDRFDSLLIAAPALYIMLSL
ncbi:MAG: phosphatidate cytidylyltransferase [Candidatus Cloacimonetes bacterium]|nr:phosphatidate cytidylyltransferase [Candidatus Cloacimonadota bacterium]